MKKLFAVVALLIAGTAQAEPIRLACDWITPVPDEPTMHIWIVDLEKAMVVEEKWGFDFKITQVTDSQIIGEAGTEQNWFRVEIDRQSLRLKNKYPGSITTFQCQVADDRLT